MLCLPLSNSYTMVNLVCLSFIFNVFSPFWIHFNFNRFVFYWDDISDLTNCSINTAWKKKSISDFAMLIAHSDSIDILAYERYKIPRHNFIG